MNIVQAWKSVLIRIILFALMVHVNYLKLNALLRLTAQILCFLSSVLMESVSRIERVVDEEKFVDPGRFYVRTTLAHLLVQWHQVFDDYSKLGHQQLSFVKEAISSRIFYSSLKFPIKPFAPQILQRLKMKSFQTPTQKR